MSASVKVFSISLLSAVAMTANRVSSVQSLDGTTSYSVQYSWSGTTPVGNLLIEGSTDGVNFAPVKTIAISGASGNAMDSESGYGYSTLRVSYAFTSGTGTLTVSASAKS